MIKSGIFIFFLHALNPSEWTGSIELGVKKELRKTGIKVSSKSYHATEYDVETILNKIRKKKPDYVVITNDLKKEDYYIVDEIRSLGIHVVFAGKKTPLAQDEFAYEGVRGREKFKRGLDVVQKVIPHKIKTVGIISTPSPLIQLLVKSVREDLSGFEIKEIKTKTFEEYEEAIKILSKETDLFIPFLPYGGSYKGKRVTVGHWKFYRKALKRLNKKTPTIGGGTLRNSKMPVLLSYAMSPEGLGTQAASSIYGHLTGQKISKKGLANPNFYQLQVNVDEFKRIGLTIPDDLYGFATLINDEKNKIASLREELKQIDLSIFNLVNKRQDISREIGEYKLKNKLPVIEGKRTKKVEEKLIRLAEDVGLESGLGKELSTLLIKHSVKLQHEEVFNEEVPKEGAIEDRGEGFLERIKRFFK